MFLRISNESNYPIELTEYKRFLKNKSVIIVGPAPTVKNQQDFIESFDIVVRINKSFDTTGLENDYGNRTDICYFNTGMTADLFKHLKLSKSFLVLKKFQIKWLITKAKLISLETPVPILPLSPFNSKFKDFKFSGQQCYLKGMHGTLTMGILAILDLLFYEISNLHVIGFTFYSPEINFYHEQFKNKGNFKNNSHIHNNSTIKKWLRDYSKTDDRLSFDEVTKLHLNN
jgi:hypothetical protein